MIELADEFGVLMFNLLLDHLDDLLVNLYLELEERVGCVLGNEYNIFLYADDAS
jgi:hypothetical protein